MSAPALDVANRTLGPVGGMIVEEEDARVCTDISDDGRRVPVQRWVWVAGSVVQCAAIVGIGAVAWTLEGATAGLGRDRPSRPVRPLAGAALAVRLPEAE